MVARELVVGLMAWIGSVTALPVPLVPPGVHQVPGSVICLSVHPDLPKFCESDAGATAYAGGYTPATQRLSIADTYDPESLFFRAVLVHELVHHMQARAGMTYSCEGLGEVLAYATEKRYVEEAGLDFYAVRRLSPARVAAAANEGCD